MKNLIAQSDERAKLKALFIGQHSLHERIERLYPVGQIECQKALGRLDQNKQGIQVVGRIRISRGRYDFNTVTKWAGGLRLEG